MSHGWVLMYHRVCVRRPETECWFARGTAVTPEAFESQLAWLVERFDIVSLPEFVLGTSEGRPKVALTFDDGYRELLTTVLPICQQQQVVGTCFASASPALLGEPLWFDAWYYSVAAGRNDPRWLEHVREWGIVPPADLDGWVRGAPKRLLTSLPPEDRRQRLLELQHRGGAAVPTNFYLSLEELAELQSLGWRTGGHGGRHLRLSSCDARSRGAEIAMSVELCDRLNAGQPRLFAYPDGDWNESIAAEIGRAGFTIACTVDEQPRIGGPPLLAQPRLFARGDGPVPHPAMEGDAFHI